MLNSYYFVSLVHFNNIHSHTHSHISHMVNNHKANVDINKNYCFYTYLHNLDFIYKTTLMRIYLNYT